MNSAADTHAGDCGYVAPELHPRETERQSTLDQLRVLDTEASDRFDDLALVASELLGVPIAAISLVDRDRQWFKAELGLGVSQTPRSVSFCGHAILTPEPFVIPDALADHRFAGNPLVVGDPCIRSYVGIPISINNSDPVGTLCAIDTEPREFTPGQIRALQALANQVEHQLSMELTLRSLEDANTKLEQFSALASHDLRSPLRGVQSLVEFLREDCDDSLDDVAQRHLDGIVDRASRMETLIDDLISYARLPSTAMHCRMTPIRDILDDLVCDLDMSRVASVHVTVDPSIHATSMPFVEASMCLRNLIGNGFKHNTHDEPVVTVDVSLDPSQRTLIIVVGDNGPGIPAEYHHQLFEPFKRFQTDPSKTGSGIGLAIVDQVVRNYGGSVAVESEPGSGARFTINWPVPHQ